MDIEDEIIEDEDDALQEFYDRVLNLLRVQGYTGDVDFDVVSDDYFNHLSVEECVQEFLDDQT